MRRGILVAGCLLFALSGACSTTPAASDAGDDEETPRVDAGEYDAGGFVLEGGPIVPDGSAEDGAPADPRSCADVKASGAVTDDEYLIDPDGAGGVAPFHVYCAGLADPAKPPREYLSLASGTTNDTKFAGGGYCACPDFVRSFTKVRLDPAKRTVDTTDFTFTTTNRSATCDVGKAQCQGPGHSYFASPGSCVTNNDASGMAHLDLTGTELHVAPAETYVGEGYLPSGTVLFGANRKTATITGGGACGYWAPSPANAFRLALERD
jgi:hypothetical protein